VQRFLFDVFGKRVAFLFGAISFLLVAVLVALYLMAGYAMEGYVSDQVKRIPWDISAGHREVIGDYPRFQQKLRATPGVKQAEAFGFVRVQNTKAVRVDVDGKTSTVRWLGIIASSNPELLPPQLRAPVGAAASASAGGIKAAAAFVGGEDSNGVPFEVAAGSTIRLIKANAGADDHDHDAALVNLSGATPGTLFQATIPQAARAMERQDFNKWMLRNVGSLSYLPEMAVVVAVPMDQFARITDLLDRTFLVTGGMHGGEAPPPYVPEVLHLVRLDRDQWVSSWELGSSLDRLSPLLGDVLNDVREITSQSHMKSDLYAVLTRMDQVSGLIGIVTLLVAIPLLWLGWAVAKMLSSLLLMNERRLIGLALIRGVPVEQIGRALLTALFVGGVIGGLLGLLAGLGVPIVGQSLAGHPPPPAPVLMRGVLYFLLFIVVGVLLAILSGRGMIRRIRAMRPREAIAYISSADVEGSSERPSPLFIGASAVALLLGGYKFFSWITGFSLLARTASPDGPSATWQMLYMAEGLLNFVAVPFFLFGLVGLLRARVSWIQFVLGGITAPVAGKLRWFVADHMTLNRQRVAGTLFIASLAMSLALLPQVAADTFYDRILRGVQASVGGDVQLEYEMAGLATTGAKPLRLTDASNGLSQRLDTIEQAIRRDQRVHKVAVIQQFLAPEIFLPNQAGLFINLIKSPKEYLETVYSEKGLGLSRPFAEIIGDDQRRSLAASAGFLNVRQVPLGQDVAIGYQGDTPIPARFTDVVAFLPGAPTAEVAQREGFAAAEVDYINYLLGNDARAIAAAELFRSKPLSTLELLPSRAVFLVRMKPGASEADIEALTAGLPVKPQNVRWLAQEQRKLGRDMFISLALANMNVFMVGGLILSVAGVVVVGLANFLSERRTFSLLRLRGLPVSTLVRVSLSIFLAPVAAGILVGIGLGILAGFGISEAIWQLPRIYGVAGLLEKNVAVSGTAVTIVLGFSAALLLVAMTFALWPFRRSANENVRKS
jgi:hypothetical protein